MPLLVSSWGESALERVVQMDLPVSGHSPRSGRTKHAVIVYVSHFEAAESQLPLEDLPVSPELISKLSHTLDGLGYDTVTVDADPIPSMDLGSVVRKHWERVNADDLLIMHVLSHGHVADGGATVYVLGSDGIIDDDNDIAHWLTSLQNVKGRPLTLLLLDLCSSGTVARLPWQQGVPSENSRAWVIAACPPGLAAFDGRFTEGVATVLQALHEGELDTGPARAHVPLPVVARAIRQEVNRLTEIVDGDHQQVTASLVDLSTDPDLPFFDNPNYRIDRQAQLRAAVDPGLLPFFDDLDEGLDPRHFLERAAGVGGLADSPGEIVGCFTGRVRQLSQLSRWMNSVKDESLDPGTLCVITGSPGVGKSALLGILVCAAHHKLRAPTRLVWDRAAQVPHPVDRMAAVHARGRNIMAVVASVSRQLGLGDQGELAALMDSLRRSTGPTPVVVVDAIDEADDGPGLANELLLPLSEITRRDGYPAARLLIGVRQYEEYAPLFNAALSRQAVIDLDAVPTEEVEDNLNRYVTDLLRATTAYRHSGAVTGAFAERLASVLTKVDSDGGEKVKWGPFLVAGLYTRHIIAMTTHKPIESAAQAELAAEEAPHDLPSVLELDLKTKANQPWLLPVMSVLSQARGQGMPLSVITRCAACQVGTQVVASTPSSTAEVREALDAGRVYLRQSVDKEGTTVYRLFHQGLAEALAPRPFPQAAELLAALLAPLGPPPSRDWDAAEPYVLRHVLDHAEDAGQVGHVLADPALLMRPEASDLLQRVDTTVSPRLRAIAAVHRDPSARGSRFGWALAAIRYGLTDLAGRAANLQPPLPWQPIWTFDGRNRESRELTKQDDPILALDMSADGRVLVSYDHRNHLRTWETSYGSAPGTRLSTHTATSVAISPSGRYVVTGNAKGVVRAWDLVTGESHNNQANNQPIAAVAISDDARQVTAFNDDGTFLYWDLDSGNSPHLVHGIRPTRIEIPPTRPDEVSHLVTTVTKTICQYVAVANSTGAVGLLPIKRIVFPVGIQESLVSSVAWSRFGVVLGLKDGTVLLWKVQNAGAERSTVIGQHDGPVSCVAISSDCQTVASGGADGSLRVWQASASRQSGYSAGARLMTVAGDVALIVSDTRDIYPLALHTGELLQAPLQSRKLVTQVSRQFLDGRHGVLLHHRGEESSLWLPGFDSLLYAGKWRGMKLNSNPTVIILDNRLVEIISESDGMLSIRDIAVERKAFKSAADRALGNLPVIVAYARIGGMPVAATCSADGDTVYMWDVTDQRITDKIEVGARIWALELSADGYLLIGAGGEVIMLGYINLDKT
jgi:hypothetical protein